MPASSSSNSRKRPAAAIASTDADVQEAPRRVYRRRLRGKQPDPYPPPCPLRVPVGNGSPYRKMLYLMRGPPGCGKSTTCRALLAQHFAGWQVNAACEDRAFLPIYRAFVLSTDDFFTNVGEDGHAKYDFDPKMIGERHKTNQRRCELMMETGVTPLFVDNTNICLWEMREYVNLADRYSYTVHIIDPRSFNPRALDVARLAQNLEIGMRYKRRAAGKEIPQHVLERMCRNFEELRGRAPETDGRTSDHVVGVASEEALDAIRSAIAPFERPRPPPKPRYAGLDVEARALAALGGIPLGRTFWDSTAAPGTDAAAGSADCTGDSAGCCQYLIDARYLEDSKWKSPERLHVTVAYFGRKYPEWRRRAVETHVDTMHSVWATTLLYVRGGGLLCATCEFGDSAAVLNSIADAEWRPHITLITAEPWFPRDSTALILAWERAVEARAATCAAGVAAGAATDSGAMLPDLPVQHSAETGDVTARDAASSNPDSADPALQPIVEASTDALGGRADALTFGGAAQSATRGVVDAAASGALPQRVDAATAAEVYTQVPAKADEAIAVATVSERAPPTIPTSDPDSGQVAETQVETTQEDEPQSSQVPAQVPPEATDCETEIFHSVVLGEEIVDICAIRLRPPRPLGQCRLKMFY